ncbi:MAG: NADH-quinone oxidoreductase subunit NuoE [Planctomycetota bacterium]
MAWITKDSANTQIDRRDEPYLSDAFKKSFDEKYAHRYPDRRALSLPILHAIQHEYNYLPYQALEEAADFLGIGVSDLLDTATFYEEYFLEPKGKYTVWVCQSVSCEIMGEGNVTQAISDKLGIQPGETTADGKFTLMKVECLGACGGAPCALINEDLAEDLTPENVIKRLEVLD